MSDEFSKGRGGGQKPGAKKRTNSQPLAAADVLQALLQNSKSQLSEGFQRWRLEQNWSVIVGPTIAAQTAPAALEHGTLYVWVQHSAWMQQLWYFQEPIKEKVNAHMGKPLVKQVKFTLNRRAALTVPSETES